MHILVVDVIEPVVDIGAAQSVDRDARVLLLPPIVPCAVKDAPAVSTTSCSGFRPLSGSSAMFLASIEACIAEEVVSTSAAWPSTSTVSSTAPTPWSHLNQSNG